MQNLHKNKLINYEKFVINYNKRKKMPFLEKKFWKCSWRIFWKVEEIRRWGIGFRNWRLRVLWGGIVIMEIILIECLFHDQYYFNLYCIIHRLNSIINIFITFQRFNNRSSRHSIKVHLRTIGHTQAVISFSKLHDNQ